MALNAEAQLMLAVMTLIQCMLLVADWRRHHKVRTKKGHYLLSSVRINDYAKYV